MPKQEPKKDILDILREAEEANRADIDAPVAARQPELEKTKVHGEEEPPKKRTKVTSRINAETAELIDQYSTHKEEKTQITSFWAICPRKTSPATANVWKSFTK